MEGTVFFRRRVESREKYNSLSGRIKKDVRFISENSIDKKITK